MDEGKIININDKKTGEIIEITEDETILFFQGERINLKSLLLAGETTDGERVVISSGNSLDQSILLKEELVFAVQKEMEKRYED